MKTNLLQFEYKATHLVLSLSRFNRIICFTAKILLLVAGIFARDGPY